MLLSVARLERNKGLHVLADALGSLKDLAWRWVIVGDGPFRRALETRIAGNGLQGRVLMPGRLQDASLHAWYEAASIFVHPTQYEGSSIVTLEAMSHRRPVVATIAGGLPDKVRHGETGWLVPPGDAPALARVLRTAIGAQAGVRYNGRRRPGAGRGGVLVGPLGRSHAGRLRGTAHRKGTRVTDRAGLDESGGRPFAAALAVVMAAGFLLRVWNLGSGIPFAVGIDEPAIMTTVVRILKSGSFNPHFFEYPTGYIYVQVGTAIVNFLVGAMRHSWKAVEQVGPSDFYLWGRFVTAAIGTATIALVYRAGLRWGPRAGLAAAALLAVMPMHVRESHFVLTDVPMTFAVDAHPGALAAGRRASHARRVRSRPAPRPAWRRASSTTA